MNELEECVWIGFIGGLLLELSQPYRSTLETSCRSMYCASQIDACWIGPG